MAGLIGLTAADIDIQDALNVSRWAYEGAWIPHPVVRLTTAVPIAVNATDGERIAVRGRWGFPVGGRRSVGNCRDDRLLESRLWRGMLGTSPCLVPATGVYEMVKRGTDKRSYWFRRAGGSIMVLPGLCSSRTLDGEEHTSFAIVTTEPNAFFEAFHDRQVCQLTPAEADAWMAGGEPEAVMKLLHAPPEDDWEAVPVDSRIFGRGRIEDADLIQVGEPIRAGDRPPGQQTLF